MRRGIVFSPPLPVLVSGIRATRVAAPLQGPNRRKRKRRRGGGREKKRIDRGEGTKGTHLFARGLILPSPRSKREKKKEGKKGASRRDEETDSFIPCIVRTLLKRGRVSRVRETRFSRLHPVICGPLFSKPRFGSRTDPWEGQPSKNSAIRN